MIAPADRGDLLSRLPLRRPAPPLAVLGGGGGRPGLIFGVVHAGTGVAAIPFLAALGVVFAYLYERTGSLWPSIIAHTLNNLLAITVQITT